MGTRDLRPPNLQGFVVLEGRHSRGCALGYCMWPRWGRASPGSQVCRHPAGAQFEFLDTLSHGLTPVASGVSPPVGA